MRRYDSATRNLRLARSPLVWNLPSPLLSAALVFRVSDVEFPAAAGYSLPHFAPNPNHAQYLPPQTRFDSQNIFSEGHDAASPGYLSGYYLDSRPLPVPPCCELERSPHDKAPLPLMRRPSLGLASTAFPEPGLGLSLIMLRSEVSRDLFEASSGACPERSRRIPLQGQGLPQARTGGGTGGR